MANITYNQISVGFTDSGQGNALVLLHGFTESRAIWEGFVAILAKNFRVVTIDLPGHGESGLSDDTPSMTAMAEAVKAVLDHLGISRCVMVGHSMGGYVSLAMARQHPDLLAGLGLFHSSAAADSEEGRKTRDKAIGVIRQDRQRFLFQFIPSLFAEGNRDNLRPVIDELIAAASGMSAEAIIAAQEGMKVRADHRDLLRHAPFPVLFIAGKQDIRIPIDGILPQVALPCRSYSLILDDVGHMGWAEAPEATLAMVRMFVLACT